MIHKKASSIKISIAMSMQIKVNSSLLSELIVSISGPLGIKVHMWHLHSLSIYFHMHFWIASTFLLLTLLPKCSVISWSIIFFHNFQNVSTLHTDTTLFMLLVEIQIQGSRNQLLRISNVWDMTLWSYIVMGDASRGSSGAPHLKAPPDWEHLPGICPSKAKDLSVLLICSWVVVGSFGHDFLLEI